ncbi:PBSX family phage terminase large subunit [Allobaculum fili]|uniref:PBSX family phage terminase large subunit n=1 Tax=Allobaculum fili TaxID=2834460 RepID=UPI001E5E9FC7|nr:PBSX family phage terminase large subunit [Allobaculum fili]
MKTEKIYLPDIVGKGYKTFWNFKGRYRVVKGSRASKKSKTTALWFIYNLMKYPGSNLLVVRKTYRTLKDSCFTDLQWACQRLKCSRFWEFKLSPLEATYKPTGQKILFRGLDDPLKVTSITVPVGSLCWGWIEEAYELTSEEDFSTLDESIRGELPDGLWKQWTITFNPWNEHHWLKKRFFDAPESENILALTTNYLCNEWLDQSDLELFEDMKKRNPRRYEVAGLGNWGIVDGLVYENFHIREFEITDIGDAVTVSGLDFGFTNDPTAFFVGFADKANRKLWVWDEIYEKGMTNSRIYERIEALGYRKNRIIADCADAKSIYELARMGLKINGSRKGADSIRAGVQFIQDYEIIIKPRCVNFITEIQNYQWAKDKFGSSINKPIDDFNHLMDAMRYAMEPIQRGSVKVRSIKGGF